MILDALLLLADAQRVQGADTDVSDNTIDLGDVTPNRAIGTGEPLGVAVSIDSAAVVSAGETYTVQVISSAAANLGSPTVLQSHLMTAAQLLAGALTFVALPPGAPVQRYLGVQIVKTGAGADVTFTAWLTSHSMFALQAKAYAKNYNV
jgi:hypothetical protein